MFISTALQGFNSNYFTQVRDNRTYPTFSQTQAFTKAGSVTRVVLPDYVNMIRVYAWGGGGGAGDRGPTQGILTPNTSFNTPSSLNHVRLGGPGGDGGFVQADVPIAPGTILYVRVAEGGIGYMPSDLYANVNAPRGRGFLTDATGGGYSSVELPPAYPVPTRYLVVAGGGGGGGRAPPLFSDPNGGNPTSSRPYSPGADGGPAYSPGTGGSGTPLSPGPLNGRGGSNSAGGPGGSFSGADIRSTFTPNTPGTVSVVTFPAVPGATGNGSFLLAGGNTNPIHANTQVKWGGASSENIRITRVISPVPNPGSGSPFGGGASGGAGWYGGGAGITGDFTTFTNIDWGRPAGGGGSSYINPTSSNVTQANISSGYNSHPLITTYQPIVADANVGVDALSIGIGGGPYPWYNGTYPQTGTPYPWLYPIAGLPGPGSDVGGYGRNGGQGLVVIVY